VTDEQAAPSTSDGIIDPSDLARALEPGARLRCEQCGNVTRFDVVARERTRRFFHYDLGGDAKVDEHELLERVVESVTCRWCGRDDAVRAEPAPAYPTGRQEPAR
jgi:hypothetical protein